MRQDDPVPSIEFDQDRLQPRLSVEIPGHVGAISPVVEEILTVTRRMGCAVDKEFEVETALREALANAVRHGCGRDPEKKVQVCVACDDSRGMLIVVRDPGPGFDPREIPDPVRGESLFSSGGRGIFLINSLMDHVAYAEGGTEIRMLKR